MSSFYDKIRDLREPHNPFKMMTKHNIRYDTYRAFLKLARTPIKDLVQQVLTPVVPCYLGYKNESYFTEEEMLNGYLVPTLEEVLEEYPEEILHQCELHLEMKQ